jgi:PEGA domain
MRARPALIAALLAISIGVAPPLAAMAAPTDPSEASRELFLRGNELRKKGDCAGALDLFLQSRALVARPANTLNAAFCANEIGRREQAYDLYEGALSDFGGDLDPAETKSVRAELDRLRAALATVEVQSKEPEQLFVDGEPRGSTPLAKPLHLEPGQHRFRVEAEGREPSETTLVLQAGESYSFVLTVSDRQPAPSIVPEPPPAPRSDARPHAATKTPPTPTGPTWRAGVESFGGLAISPSLGDVTGADCAEPCAVHEVGLGGIVGARFAVTHASGFGIEVGAGYARIGAGATATFDESFGGDVGSRSYTASDSMRADLGFAVAGPRYDLRIGPRFGLTFAADAGFVHAHARWAADAKVSTMTGSSDATVIGSGGGADANGALVGGEVRAVYLARPFRIGATVGGLYAPMQTAELASGDVVPTAPCNGDPSTAGCSPGSAHLAGARRFGPFGAAVLGVVAGWETP